MIIYLFIYLFIHLFIYLFIYLFVYLLILWSSVSSAVEALYSYFAETLFSLSSSLRKSILIFGNLIWSFKFALYSSREDEIYCFISKSDPLAEII